MHSRFFSPERYRPSLLFVMKILVPVIGTSMVVLKMPRDFVCHPVMKQASVCLFGHLAIISFEKSMHEGWKSNRKVNHLKQRHRL